MGRGRAPCCDKSQVKKGPWCPAEDLRLTTFIQKHGHGNWRALPKQAGLLRCGKSCRLRWINYLRPDVKRGNFTREEEETIIKQHQSFGNKWSKIASSLPGRTDNEIKNVWNTHLKKRLVNYNHKDHETKFSPSPPSSSDVSSFTPSFKNHENMRDQGVFQDQGCLAKTSTHQVYNVIKVLEKEQNSLVRILTDSPITKEQFNTQNSNLCVDIPITDEPKEVLSSSSISSYASNYSNSSTRVDVSMPQEGDSLFNCVFGPCDQVDYTAHGVLNNQSSVALDHQLMIEIDTLESDMDLWAMLDNLDPLQPNESQPQDQYLELASQSSNNFGEECEQGEIECRRWLRYLENELGLGEATKEGGHYQDYINQTKDAASDDQMTLMPETDTQSFGI